jgi:hypothetical protein
MKQGAGRGQKEIRRPALLFHHPRLDASAVEAEVHLRRHTGGSHDAEGVLRSCHAGGSHDHPNPGEERKAGCAPGQGNKSLTASRR